MNKEEQIQYFIDILKANNYIVYKTIGDNDDIMISGIINTNDKYYFEITSEWDNTITFVYEKDNEEILYENDLSFENAKELLNIYLNKINGEL